MRDERQRVIDNIPNVLTILGLDGRWRGVFRYNEMQRRVYVHREIPSEEGGAGCKPRPLQDRDVSRAKAWFQRYGGMWTVGDGPVREGIEQYADRNSYHPIREELETFRWDGQARIESWLVDFCGAADSPYVRAIGRMFLVALVRRVMEPGCKMDYMLILEGEQGIGKSTVPLILAGEDYFGEAQFDNLTSVDTSIFIRNKWVVEFGELHMLRKSEVNELKMWLAKRVEDYRPKYGRENVVEPRQCVFIGTSNNSEYLNDPTGGRRFWPVACQWIKRDELREVRGQLLAEAVQLWRDGVSHFPDAEMEREHFKPEQEARQSSHPWEEFIAPLLKTHNRLTNEVLYNKVGLGRAQVGKLQQEIIKGIMLRAGWTFVKKSGSWVWVNPIEIKLPPVPTEPESEGSGID